MTTTTPELTVYMSGAKEWRFNGELHRTDGPAIEQADGTKHWYVNGKCHREDGPAIEYADGDKSWYLNNIRYHSFYIYAKAAKWTDEQIVEWKLTQ
jgi:hypothetical protein